MDKTTKTERVRKKLPMSVNVVGKALADEHWKYILDLLRIHISEWDQDNFLQLEFHYKTAMIHGYKHGVADRERTFESEAAKETVD